MEPALRPSEIRVLGALMEKAMSTPDHYPLSLNALKSACNQKNNREPVMDLDEQTISDALMTLARKDLVETVAEEGSRVDKYRHRFSTRFQVTLRQMAILCELFLRGPQTPGELHTHARRLTDIGTLDEVAATIESIQSLSTGSMVKKLPKRPGQKDQRYMHVLCPDLLKEAECPHGASGPIASGSAHGPSAEGTRAVLLKHSDDERVNFLMEEVASLKRDIAILSERMEGISRQVTVRSR